MYMVEQVIKKHLQAYRRIWPNNLRDIFGEDPSNIHSNMNLFKRAQAAIFQWNAAIELDRIFQCDTDFEGV